MTEREKSYVDQYQQLLEKQGQSVESQLTLEMERYQFWRALEKARGEEFALRVYRICNFK